MKKFVTYQGKRYEVLADTYLGNDSLFKLASRTSGGSPFPATKAECR